ncbi:hypothetical protein CAEBREN_14146 [Caenorhabditis brenneri]|uniref:Integrase zinc-binding domain-containing protein n=1 Tax=Caenorhabditis brenneri TaxID=135651 RepID=G0PDQ8_CAEBE|nr:hypothetical protein CAEBREN_14146 [Caenorhabditis brenneri]
MYNVVTRILKLSENDETKIHLKAKLALIRLAQQLHSPDERTINNLNLVRENDVWFYIGRVPDRKVPFLPAHRIAKLFVIEIHLQYKHSSPMYTLAKVRNEVWIPKGLSFVTKAIRECLFCQRQNSKPTYQPQFPMLPQLRTSWNQPFSFTGMDYAGPFLAINRDVTHKYWLLLFTCLSTRYTHVELVSSLDALEFVGENDEECFVDWISKAMKANNRDNTETRGLKRFPPPSLIPDGFFWNQFNGRLHRKLQGGREVQEVVLKGRAIVSYYDEISDEFYKFREDWMDVGLFYSEESKSLQVFAQDCTSRESEFSRRLVTPCEEITPRTPFKCSHIKLSNETVQFFFLLIDDRDEFISAIKAAIRQTSDPNKFPVPKPHTLLSYETESGVVVINEGDLQSNSNSRNSAQRGCTPDSPCINLACLRCLPLSRRRMRSPPRIETARQETRDMREVTAETKLQIHQDLGVRMDDRQRLILENSRNITIQLSTNSFVESWKPVEAEAGPSNGYSVLDASDAMDFSLASPQPAPRSTMTSSTPSNRLRNPPVKSTIRLHQRQDNRRTSLQSVANKSADTTMDRQRNRRSNDESDRHACRYIAGRMRTGPQKFKPTSVCFWIGYKQID